MKVDLLLKTPRWLFAAAAFGAAVLPGSSALAAEEGAKASADVLQNIVVRKARQLAQEGYREPEKVDKQLAEMDYQEYRSIRFKPEESLWRGDSLFELQLFHTGFLYQEPVQINISEEQGLQNRLDFDSNLFRYDDQAARFEEGMSADAGYAGFRVHYPINGTGYYDEVVVFQGATYFRPVGPGQVYGISARGLAIDTAEPGGEEFPSFREFWLVKPKPEETQLTIFALMDSPSATGAFRFVLSPDVPTTIDVDAKIFARNDVNKLGIAPLTSMFLYGENRVRSMDDFRPEVHDSDGLVMQTSDDNWIWRPLANPRHLHVSSLQEKNPKGFGLLQRDRDFDNYEDTEANYERRPSLWVEPQGDWGEGRVELVEIPTEKETNDNIVAYWVPKDQLKAGEESTVSYRLHTLDADPPHHNLAKVESTRIGAAGLPGMRESLSKDERQFVVDFAGGNLDKVSGELPVKAHLQLSNGQTRDLDTIRLPDGDRWRVVFKLLPEDDKPVDMRLFIALRDQRLSEVWSYVWQPNNIQ